MGYMRGEMSDRAMQAEECGYCKTIGHTNPSCPVKLQKELSFLKTCGIIEVMCVNPSVDSWVQEHEKHISTLESRLREAEECLRQIAESNRTDPNFQSVDSAKAYFQKHGCGK